MQQISVIILTYNEALHLERCIRSLRPFVARIFVVDSFSEDDTVAIAEKLGAEVFQNPWTNQAAQFQWALDHCPIDTPWVMRMDADEYVTPGLGREIREQLPKLDAATTGVYVKRRVHFMGRWIRHGGYYPLWLLRLWRTGAGRIEQRWMDEHVVLKNGKTVRFSNDLVDDNLQTLSWWTDKHNRYATREAIDLLNRRYCFFEEDSIEARAGSAVQSEQKRWMKNNVYYRMPRFLRAFLYFNYRYWLQRGFLDGRPGLIWHFLQGFWYRFLVDAKITQIEYLARTRNKSVKAVIEEEYGYALTPRSTEKIR